jgi:glutamate-ammonia-ligase adenylyltransferase
MALLAGLADLGGVWPTEGTLHALSATADAVLEQATAFLFRKAREASQIVSQEDVTAPGYFVIAMGKLGACELNYSSDIASSSSMTPSLGLGQIEPATFFVRLTRARASAPGALRTAISSAPISGSDRAGATQIALGGEILLRASAERARGLIQGAVAISPQARFSPVALIWRKYLDFAAIADIHAMKRRVHAFKGHGAIAVEGHDIKLGRGGIRDIEFFAQTQQLIAGGRHPELRTRGTVETLDHLAKGGWIAPDAATELAAAYLFLRRIENRLQMVEDQQTHIIPAERAELDRVARLSGFAETNDFGDALLGRFKRVETHYEALFEKLPEAPKSAPTLVGGADADHPTALAGLERLGFRNPDAAIAAVRAWQSGRYAATRSERARERLIEFLPALLDAFGRTAEPDLALLTFDRVISGMPAGLQLFSLLAANPSLLRLIADIMGTAPRLARIIGRRPRLLDAVLDPGFFGTVPTPARLRELAGATLAEAPDYQEALERARIVGREQAFLIGVRVISGTLSARQAGAAYTDLAESLIEALAKRVEEELVGSYGRMKGGEAAILAMGKLGGREMTAGSDLDLIVVYDYEGENPQSDGAKNLPGAQYYTRFTQRLIAALSAETAEGSLYQVDMRLRPSGSQGPVATKLSSFTAYQKSSAWTWEHLALTRARVLSGPPSLRQQIDETIKGVLSAPRDRETVAADVRTMRAKIADEKGSLDIWDLKQVRGGLIDLEFIAQFLQIVGAAKHPEVLDQNTEAALAKLASAGVLAPGDADILVPAARLCNTLTQVLRLCLDKPFAADQAPRALKDLLARASEMPDFTTLEASLKDTLAAVYEAFDRIVA